MQKALAFLPVWLILSTVSISMTDAQLATGWRAHDLKRPLPPVVTPGENNHQANPPSDAVVLFDGTNLEQWFGSDGEASRWKVVDGAMESVNGAGYIFTKESFGDCQLHIEWATPIKVEGNGQGRGNSGVFLMGKYEIQVLDSYQNDTYADGSAGAIYGQYPPLVNACRPPGEWQSYDIIFHQPKFNERAEIASPAKLTVLHNGVLIQDAEELFGPTDWIFHGKYEPGVNKAPLSLQDHGNPVRFRNIWIRHLDSSRAKPAEPYRSETAKFALTAEQKSKLVGQYGSISVEEKGEQLVLNHLGRQLELVPVTVTEFEFRLSAGHATFELDEQGQPVAITGAVDAAGRFSGRR